MHRRPRCYTGAVTKRRRPPHDAGTAGESIADSLRDYTRAVGGGLIVGLPLLFTMEVWWHGFILPRGHLLALLGVTFAIVLGYNSLGGFRRERDVRELVIDSMSAIGLGILVALAALVVLGRIDATTGLRDAAGKVALEAIPIAFGASVASAQLSGRGNQRGQHPPPLLRLFVGAGGALLFALNVAPTEEPVMLGLEASSWLLLLVVAASLAVTFGLVFYADFGGRRVKRGDDLLDNPFTETVTSYVVSLGVALLLLWAFGRLDGASPRAILGMSVMLALVGSVGAAVARLLVSGAAPEEEDA
jgi:putative integral membrane protein (TIGR02587 family)